MLTNPVYCQDNFYFCTATPRPGQHLLQQTGGRNWFQGEAKLQAEASVPRTLVRGFASFSCIPRQLAGMIVPTLQMGNPSFREEVTLQIPG